MLMSPLISSTPQNESFGISFTPAYILWLVLFIIVVANG